MKIFSWNVNGIRSVFRNSFYDWLRRTDPDIVCLQEIKANVEDLSEEHTHIDGYHAFFNPAAKKGYAGVAVYTKIKPLAIETKLGIDRFDDEGRCLKLTFQDFTLFNLYLPHGDRTKKNLGYKLEAYEKLSRIVEPFAQKETILIGDFNIAHTEQDLYFPKQNTNNIMFTPEEREQLNTLVRLGYTDTFRHVHPDQKSYTWWPYIKSLRERDIGWRLDYMFASKPLLPGIQDAFMQKETTGSDHCPYGITLHMPVWKSRP